MTAKRHPNAKELKVFGFGMVPFSLLLAAVLRLQGASLKTGAAVIGAAVTVSLLFWAMPSRRVAIYRAWMALTRPIGWLVAHLAMAILYFGMIMPLGFLLRLLQGDRMRLECDAQALSYWQELPSPPDKLDYFKES